MHNLNTAVEVAEVAEVAEVNLEQDWGYRYLTRHFPIDGRVAHLPFSHFPFPIAYFYFSPIPFSLSLCPLSPFPPLFVALVCLPSHTLQPKRRYGLAAVVVLFVAELVGNGSRVGGGPGAESGA